MTSMSPCTAGDRGWGTRSSATPRRSIATEERRSAETFAASIDGVVAVDDIDPPATARRAGRQCEATKAKRDQMRAERLAKAAPAEEVVATERARILNNS